MKRTRYREEQILGVLKEGETGIAVAELCRKYGISDATYYNWKSKCGGISVSGLKRLRRVAPIQVPQFSNPKKL